MSRKSTQDKDVSRVSKSDLKRPSKANLDRLREAMKGDIDTSDIPESSSFTPIKRDKNGVLPVRKSMIRDAIDARRKELGITPYRLWKMARSFHISLSQAAVHEFLKGQRQLELPSAEALLSAVNLQIYAMIEKNQATIAKVTKKRRAEKPRRLSASKKGRPTTP